MALKAGRVGVAPDQVDDFGKVKSDATSGYTKQEADAKFETQTHAASTYETKSDAAALQPIQLSVPIEMMGGTKLTVESALQGLQSDKFDRAEQRVLGAKNILPDEIEQTTVNGVTITRDANGVINLNGTCNADSYRRIKKMAIPNGKYIISDDVENHTNCDIYINATKHDDTIQYGVASTGGANQVLTADNSLYKEYDIGLYFKNGIIFSNFKVYPMLRLASDPDDTYAPYAMTNREITEWILSHNN